MADRYSMREAREVLKTNEKSLKAWMRKEGIEPQIDLMDERKKYITRAQVEQLAKRHGRTLPEEHGEGAAADASPGATIAALDARLFTLEQQLTHRFDQLDARLEELLAELQRIRTSAPRASNAISAASASTSTSPTTTIPPRLTRQTRSKRKTKAKKKLPSTLVPLSTFRQVHSVSEKAVENAVTRNKLAVVRGEWVLSIATSPPHSTRPDASSSSRCSENDKASSAASNALMMYR